MSRKTNTGFKGVSKATRKGAKVRYEAYLVIDKRRTWIGSSTELNKAVSLRTEYIKNLL